MSRKLGERPRGRENAITIGTADFNKPSYARSGLVYFVQRPSDLAIKIGFTRNLGVRVAYLASRMRQPLRTLGVLPGTMRLERELHEWFSTDAVLSGCEWFAPSGELLWFVSTFTSKPLDPHAISTG